MRGARRVSLAVLIIASLVWLGNTSLWQDRPGGAPVLLAHRGLGQDFTREGLTGETCTAGRMRAPEHGYIENTIASIRAAFEYGADIVEFDVHPTTDGHFAVFHDWTIDCRTNGTGVTREQTLGYLKTLDIGYGYTADGGESYPFRGKGVGAMPSLDEVLETFTDKTFLIHIKSNDPAEGQLLSARLNRLSSDRLSQLSVYGGNRPVDVVRAEVPLVRTMSGSTLTGCILRYVGMGWSGYIPQVCKRTMLQAPANIAPWLWGWPHRFVHRLASVETLVCMQDDYGGGGFSTGLNRVVDLEKVPSDYAGGIWTDRIDLIGPAVRQRSRASR